MSRDGSESRNCSDRGRTRAQLVLAAAAVVAVALAPAVLAYQQLGYHPDVTASAEYDAPLANAERVLERAVHEAGANVTGRYDWSERERAVEAVDDRLGPPLDALAGSRVAAGTAYEVDDNASAARAWARENCPGGPNRQFGACRASDGVVVQGRAGDATVLAVAFDVRATTERGTYEATVVVGVVETVDDRPSDGKTPRTFRVLAPYSAHGTTSASDEFEPVAVDGVGS